MTSQPRRRRTPKSGDHTITSRRGIVDALADGLGPTHHETLIALANLALAYYDNGEYEQARTIQERVLAQRRRNYPATDEHMLRDLRNLAWTLYRLDKLPEAKRIFRRLLKIRQTNLQGDSPALWTAMEDLAWTIRVAGDTRGARKLQEAVLHSRQAYLGPGDLATIAAMETLAATDYAEGELSQARQLQEAALDALLEIQPADSPRVLNALGNLALTQQQQGDLLAAREMQERARSAHMRLSGLQNPDTLTAISNLANTLCRLNELEEAKRLQTQVLEMRAIIDRGAVTAGTLDAMSDLAQTLHVMGAFQGADELQRHVLHFTRTFIGPNADRTLSAMVSLASTLIRRDQYEEAETLLEDAVRRRKRASGIDHPETLTAMATLASLLQTRGDIDGARRMQLRVLAIRKARLGEDHPHTLHSMGEVAALYSASARWKRASELGRIVMQQRERTLGSMHPETLAAMNNLAYDLSRREATIPECVQLLEKIIGVLQQRSTPMSFTGSWVAESAVRLLSELVGRGVKMEWRKALKRLSRQWSEALQVAGPSLAADGLWDAYVGMHSYWLDLCIAHAPSDVPLVLCALQGREMAWAMMEELHAHSMEGSATEGRKRYLSALGALRARRLQLTVFMQNSRAVEDGSGHSATPSMQTKATYRDRRAFERQLVKEYEHDLSRLKELERELASADPDFSFAVKGAARTSFALGKALGNSDGLMLLFATESGEGLLHHACCVKPSGRVRIVPLPGLSAIVNACERHIGMVRQGASAREMRGGMAHPDGASAAATLSVSARELMQSIDDILWKPLRLLYPATRRWHVAAHQNLHNIPLAGLIDTDDAPDIRIYPGIAFFGRSAPSVRTTEGLLLHVDPGWEVAPIPLVEADALLAQMILPDVLVSRGEETLHQLEHAASKTRAFGAASHGGVTQDSARQRQAEIVLQASSRKRLDAAAFLATGSRPQIAVLATCLAASVYEPFGGEPFGLVSALLMRDCKSVLGSLAAIPDFFTPLLIGLFWEAWCSSSDSANAALRTAKRNLRNGTWPAGFADKVRMAYSQAMEAVLEKAAQSIAAETRLVPTLNGWLLPHDIRQRYFVNPTDDLLHRFVEEHCASDFARAGLVAATLDRLIDERSCLPHDMVDHLCIWFGLFGSGHADSNC